MARLMQFLSQCLAKTSYSPWLYRIGIAQLNRPVGLQPREMTIQNPLLLQCVLDMTSDSHHDFQ